MNEKFIISLIEKFNESEAVSLELRQGEEKLVLRKKEAFVPSGVCAPVQSYGAGAPVFAETGRPVPPVPAAQSSDPAVQPPAVQPQEKKSPAAGTAEDASLVPVKSPIVGTFYRAPSPDSPVYVEEGKAVKKGDPLCILEAMKMMNTLECEFDCTVEKILVQNGDLVEFDQPLFLVRKK